MITGWIRKTCMALPHTTEVIQWNNHLVFKVGGKIYAIAALDPGGICVSLKCSPESFAELVERESVIPAPYLARAHWIAMETEDAISRAELKQLLERAHALVRAKLPRKYRI